MNCICSLINAIFCPEFWPPCKSRTNCTEQISIHLINRLMTRDMDHSVSPGFSISKTWHQYFNFGPIHFYLQNSLFFEKKYFNVNANGLARHESNVAGFGADATLLDQRVTLDTCLSFFTCSCIVLCRMSSVVSNSQHTWCTADQYMLGDDSVNDTFNSTPVSTDSAAIRSSVICRYGD